MCRFKIALMVFGILIIAASGVYAQTNDFPAVLSIRERAAVVDKITQLRLDRLLGGFMKETGFDMWIITCNEDNYDPVFLTMIPYDAWCPITQILVFYAPGAGKPIERLNISRTDMMGLHEKVWTPAIKSSAAATCCIATWG